MPFIRDTCLHKLRPFDFLKIALISLCGRTPYRSQQKYQHLGIKSFIDPREQRANLGPSPPNCSRNGVFGRRSEPVHRLPFKGWLTSAAGGVTAFGKPGISWVCRLSQGWRLPDGIDARAVSSLDETWLAAKYDPDARVQPYVTGCGRRFANSADMSFAERESLSPISEPDPKGKTGRFCLVSQPDFV